MANVFARLFTTHHFFHEKATLDSSAWFQSHPRRHNFTWPLASSQIVTIRIRQCLARHHSSRCLQKSTSPSLATSSCTISERCAPHVDNLAHSFRRQQQISQASQETSEIIYSVAQSSTRSRRYALPAGILEISLHDFHSKSPCFTFMPSF